MMSKTDSTLFIYSIGHIRVKVCLGAYGFSLKELFHPPHLYSSGFLSLPDHLRRLPSPTLADRFFLGFPIDYGPVLLLRPFGSHLTMDTLPSEVQQAVALGRSWLYPAFAFVPV